MRSCSEKQPDPAPDDRPEPSWAGDERLPDERLEREVELDRARTRGSWEDDR